VDFDEATVCFWSGVLSGELARRVIGVLVAVLRWSISMSFSDALVATMAFFASEGHDDTELVVIMTKAFPTPSSVLVIHYPQT
jgi:hypothetical protein